MSDLKENLLAALSMLDVNNDDHWTDDSLPTVSAVQELAGSTEINRAMIREVAPNFTRKNPKLTDDAEPGADAPAAEPEAELTVEDLLAAKEEAEAALNNARVDLDNAQAAFDNMAKAFDTACNALGRFEGPSTFAHTNALYLQKQQELREAGVQSPIDAPRARAARGPL